MKKILLFVFVLTTCNNLFASERTDKEMLRIAEKQLYKLNGANTRGEGSVITKIVDDACYNVYATNNSFVIVSKNKEDIPVLGYSNTPYTERCIPCGMQWWMSAVSTTMNQLPITSTTRSETVKPLLNTEWGQGEPFNSLCPTLDGKNAPSGCVATAMAQIINYFKYPETGKGVSSYTVLGGFRPWSLTYGTTYRYDLLKNNYDANTMANLTEEEQNAISTLLLHCGAAVKMKYNTDGSGASLFDAADGMATYFRYDSLSLHCYNREFFTNEEWMDIIKKELAVNHPILYSGSDARGGGHAFVLDGINDEGLVHINWGWDGECNGYYAIDGLTPKRTAGFEYGYNFSSRQTMIVGYKLQEKPDQDDSYNSFWATDTPYTISISGNKFLIKNIGGLYNYNWMPFEGSISLIFEEDKENGQQYKVVIDEENLENYTGIKLWGYSYDEFEPIPFARVNNVQMPSGTYKVYIGSKDVKESRYTPLRCGNYTGKIYFTVNRDAGGNYTIDSDRKTYSTYIHSMSVSRTNDKNIYDLRGRNLGTDASTLPKGVYIIDGKKVVK